MTRKEKLKAALAAIVDTLVPDDKPPATPPPVPEPASPREHRTYFRPDGTICCPAHDAEFERSGRAYREPLMIPLHEWVRGPQAQPLTRSALELARQLRAGRIPLEEWVQMSPSKRRHAAEPEQATSLRLSLQRRARRWFGGA
jgi:hypothetical protein